jgi:hypothetical protein
MSRRVYFIQRQITFSQFADVLAIPSLEVKLDAGPSNFYPSVRLKLGDASLVARTNMNGHVVQLDAVGPDSDGNRQIVDTIGELFNTEITREDSNLQSAIPWAPKFERTAAFRSHPPSKNSLKNVAPSLQDAHDPF